jgi:hypothetical protein
LLHFPQCAMVAKALGEKRIGEVGIADTMADGWRHWARHEHALEASGYGFFPSDEETLIADAGRNVALVRIIGERIANEDNTIKARGSDPHVWEPAFMNVCAGLMLREVNDETI